MSPDLTRILIPAERSASSRDPKTEDPATFNSFAQADASGPVQAVSSLQAFMVRSSLESQDGRNAEQVEIGFADGISPERIIAAWRATVQATAALRARFRFELGEVCGISEGEENPAIQIIEDVPDCWETWLSVDRAAGLPLTAGLPWRAVYFPKVRKLVWTFHHALLDGRSITSIVRGFLNRLEGREAEDLGLTIPHIPSQEEIDNAAEFHRNAFAEVSACKPEFPGDTADGPVRISRCLGRRLAEQLEIAARQIDVTAATMITWAWGQAVAAAAGVERVAIGQVRSGPRRTAQAGFTMNTVPVVVCRFDGEIWAPAVRSFREHLLSLRAIEKVSPELLPPAIYQETGGPWPGGVVMVERGTLRHEVGAFESVESMLLHEFSGEPLLASAWIGPELTLEVEVDGREFGAHAATTLADQWAAIIQQCACDPAVPIRLPTEMSDRVAGWECGGENKANLHLVDVWNDAVGRFGDHSAIVTKEGTITYRELDAHARNLAAQLVDSNIVCGATVASYLKERQHLAAVLLATSYVGAIHVPLDPALPDNRLHAIIEDAAPRIVISDDPDDCQHLGLVVQPVNAGNSSIEAHPRINPLDSLALLYTSGSTGRPKGVMMVHGGVINEALGMASLARIGPSDRVLQFASPGFDASLEEILATLLSGAALVPRPGTLAPDLDEFHRFITDHAVTILDLSTAHWAAWCAWMAAGESRLPKSIKTVIIGGERASAAAVEDWFRAGGRQHLLVNTYGPTEASVVGTAELIDGSWNESGDPAIGRPLPGVFARVADAAGRALPPGAAGELWLGGICVGPGYWKQPDLTEVSFREVEGRRWYRTGDRVFWDGTGRLRFLGRQDEQLKIRGNRVEPNEVIRVLESYPGVSSAHAGPVPAADGSAILAAWVRWERSPAEGWPALLATHAATHLATASIPTRWAHVEDFKLTERGKLDRASLPQPLLTASSHLASGPPETSTEKQLAEFWSEILQVPQIGRDESFFELGGHSLAALRLFSSISRQWKVRIPMAVLIQSPTLRSLAEIVDLESRGASRDIEPSFVVPVRAEGDQPPLFCIHGGDGGVFFYRDLARHLPAGRPVFAIEAPALAAIGEVQPVPVEETARSYVTALKRFQARGPYHLIGYSYGGLLVYEMARQLAEEGELTAFAGLVDTINPAAPAREYSLLERAEVFWEAQEHPTWRGRMGCLLRRVREGVGNHLRFKGEVKTARRAGFTEPYSELRMLQLREAHWESMKSYNPKASGCHLTLFKSQATNDKFDLPISYGWDLVASSLHIINVPGKHLTIFDSNHVGALAQEIQKRL